MSLGLLRSNIAPLPHLHLPAGSHRNGQESGCIRLQAPRLWVRQQVPVAAPTPYVMQHGARVWEAGCTQAILRHLAARSPVPVLSLPAMLAGALQE